MVLCIRRYGTVYGARQGLGVDHTARTSYSISLSQNKAGELGLLQVYFVLFQFEANSDIREINF